MLKNYTSEIAADTTLARIERLLVNAGASGVQKLYTSGQCGAIVFQIQFDPHQPPMSIRLPANVAQCQEVLWREYSRASVRGRKTREDFLEQASRTAWKLVQDWCEVQVSL